METEDITQIYETLAPMAGQYANAQAEQIGQAQQSMGPLAAQTMGSTTSGLGNYTYNRLMRPQIDVMRDEILVEGYRNQLNQALSSAYKTAQRNYNRRAGGGGGGNANPTTSGSGINDDVAKEYTGDEGQKTTTWTILPQSFKMEDENGKMITINRGPLSDEDWLEVYNDRKNFAIANGRKFEG